MICRYLVDYRCDNCQYVTTALFRQRPTANAARCVRCPGVSRRVLNPVRDARCFDINKRQRERKVG